MAVCSRLKFSTSAQLPIDLVSFFESKHHPSKRAMVKSIELKELKIMVLTFDFTNSLDL